MDWLGCFAGAGSCLDAGFNRRLILVLALGGAGALGGASLGGQLDTNWSTGFMAWTLGILGAFAGLGIGVWLIKPATE